MSTPSINTKRRQHWQQEYMEALLEWFSCDNNINRYLCRPSSMTIEQHYTSCYNDIVQDKPNLSKFCPQLIWRTTQKLQSIYNRLGVPNALEITPDRMVKISARIYIPQEKLEAAFANYNDPALPQTIITPSAPQIQESDLESSIISGLDMSDSFSTTSSSSITDLLLNHPQESSENIYNLLSKLIEQDARRLEAEERRFKANERKLEANERRLEANERRLEAEEHRKQELHVLNIAKGCFEIRRHNDALHQNNLSRLENMPK